MCRGDRRGRGGAGSGAGTCCCGRRNNGDGRWALLPGGGTAVQQDTGHDDSADDMYAYLVAMSREPEHDKIRAYCEGSVEHFEWLEDLGIHFERSYYPHKAV